MKNRILKYSKSKKYIIRYISIVIIFVFGLLIFIYGYKEKKCIEKFQSNIDQIIKEYDDKDIIKKNNKVPDDKTSRDKEINNLINNINTNSFPGDYKGQIDGILEIPSINIHAPVITGDNQYNLSKYLFVTGNNIKFNNGDYVILGHQSKLYGHSFNRILELENNDSIYIHNNGLVYEYSIYNIIIIPKDYEIRYIEEENTIGDLIILSCNKNKTDNAYTIMIKAKLKSDITQ